MVCAQGLDRANVGTGADGSRRQLKEAYGNRRHHAKCNII